MKKIIRKKKKAPAKAKPKARTKPVKAKGKPKPKFTLRPKRRAPLSLKKPAPKPAAKLVERPIEEAAPTLFKRSVRTPGKLDAKGLALLAAEAAFDKKGFDVLVLDIEGRSPIADMMVIVSGRSSTHVKSIADNVEKELATTGVKPSKRERGPMRDATWILLDFFDVHVHVFLNEQRAHYKLESLYSGAKIVAQFQ